MRGSTAPRRMASGSRVAAAGGTAPAGGLGAARCSPGSGAFRGWLPGDTAPWRLPFGGCALGCWGGCTEGCGGARPSVVGAPGPLAARGGVSPRRPGSPRASGRGGDSDRPATGLTSVPVGWRTVCCAPMRAPGRPGWLLRSRWRRRSSARICIAPGTFAVPARTRGRTLNACNGRPTAAAASATAIPGLTAKCRSRNSTGRFTKAVRWKSFLASRGGNSTRSRRGP